MSFSYVSPWLPRRALAGIALVLLVATAALGDETAIHAMMAPKAVIAPKPPPAISPGKLFPAAHCDAGFCGFDALRDIWKRDALKSEPVPYLNANAVLLERAQFEKEVARFGDPDAPAIFFYEIPGLGLCLTGIAMIRTC